MERDFTLTNKAIINMVSGKKVDVSNGLIYEIH